MYNFLVKIWTGLCNLFNLIFNRNSIEVFQIGASDVEAIFKLALPTVPISLADREYNFTNLKGWQKILIAETKDNSPYKKEFHDCDDAADELKGDVSNNWGINGCLRASGKSDSGTAHAFNVVILQDGNKVTYAIVEPQTGEIGKHYTILSIRG